MAIEHVIGLEKALLEPATRSSLTELDRLLDPSFEEIGASGRLWTRREMIAALIEAPEPEPIESANFNGRRVADDMVLVTYETGHAGRHARRSSLWHRADGGWTLLFHQGTPIPAVTHERSTDIKTR
ncbi:DUF4440 domain-containing protein [Rhodococcus sp. BP-149]|uniref:nuclear transport factor 2 family protein n=1 Tax=unclassified Rhodococcus (in: high G+C Gram-positive bacteria) TaxID=192944 RepID=UPI001C9B5E63|nr:MULTISPECIES: DUF4440 domain-containing protein [unclassified Rhodococcus (in: high G+C Gram-positive bacteria)]MBY6687248.1 DUF4440 domain-containing protein [Rhodococcus sp. BP-288]MBY6694329.1 DUF4440 domain-containing protein [Rhodococcus sp. BP-188]MBY6698038.1 DUF4440 domain-containing protein [Rhodococcus sp. BP-285]MBY6704258.1 DUF4440 domain-containing protein [Rhodococcus sp. BP-283]MBY6712907.1 DUF4440 domain-containing protein [Rhodococcus sp. BP-160]